MAKTWTTIKFNIADANMPRMYEEMFAIPMSGGPARIYLPKTMTPADLEDLADWVESIIKRHQPPEEPPKRDWVEQENAHKPMAKPQELNHGNRDGRIH